MFGEQHGNQPHQTYSHKSKPLHRADSPASRVQHFQYAGEAGNPIEQRQCQESPRNHPDHIGQKIGRIPNKPVAGTVYEVAQHSQIEPLCICSTCRQRVGPVDNTTIGYPGRSSLWHIRRVKEENSTRNRWAKPTSGNRSQVCSFGMLSNLGSIERETRFPVSAGMEGS